MVTVKILKRKDASSVIVAILIAMILTQPLNGLTSPLAGKISGLHNGQYSSFAPPDTGAKWYLYIVLWAVLQLIVLEILARIYVVAKASVKSK